MQRDDVSFATKKREIIHQRDLHHCSCCTPPRRTLVTLGPAGREQYVCPETKQAFRWLRHVNGYIPGRIHD